MAIFGSFASSTLAMISQSHAFNNISTNIANINTGGYKATDTRFATVLSRTFTSGQGSSTLSGGTPSLDSGIGGVRPTDINRINQQGNIVSSARELDVAINGKGFFVLNASQDGSGQELFTRDGSFDLSTGASFSVAGIPLSDGSAGSVTSNEGFLIDKNGYFVQGRKVGSDGKFSDSGSLQSIRLDQFAFVADFVPTTGAELVLNIPAGEAVTLPQTDQFSLSGSFAVGDVVSINVNGTTVSTAPIVATDTFQTIRDNLVAAINANATIAAAVTASASATSGTDLNITADQLSVGFTSFGSVNLTSPLVISGSTVEPVGLPETVFNIQTIDSVGVKQTPRLDLAKTANNTWEVRTTTTRTPVKQVDTITLVGDAEAGDKYNFTVNGQNITFTATGLEGDINAIRSAIVTQINGDNNFNKTVVATGTANAGEFTLSAVTAGTAFVATTSASDTGTAQVDTLTLTGAVGDVGDIYTTTIDGKIVTVPTDGTEVSLDAIRDKIVAAINSDPITGPLVTAAAGGAGQLTLTAKTTGTPFVAAATLTDVALGAVNTFTRAATTANSPVDTSTLVNTTANGAASFTSAPTTIVFNGDGTLQTPTTLTLPLTFDGGATANVALDISGITQFEGALTPVSLEFGGFAKSELASFFFEPDGVISGKFEDGTTRPLFKVPLATFTNADGLARNNGNTFTSTAESGTARVVNAGGDGVALLLANSHELSNVDLADEFTKIIVTQKAYNSAATVFRTADEILQTARDLKR
ncbi:MAG: flagellar hook-basal body complex protein [Rhodospirillaceae bacterium]|nr:flagellar hook-basal body complex protein [Rhodospirillaceae bacterium]